MKKPSTNFTVINEKTSKQIDIDSDSNWDKLNQALDVSSDEMLKRAEKEENPIRKKMMLLYAKRKKEIEFNQL